MWLFRYRDHPVAVRLQTPTMPMGGRPSGLLDVLAVDAEVARELVPDLRALMQERSVLRGQVLTFADDPYGQGLGRYHLLRAPGHGRAATSCSRTALLDRVAHHVSASASTAAARGARSAPQARHPPLRAARDRQDPHRALPALSQSPGTTAVLLSGGSLRFIHDAAKVARAHQPAIVVLEDCDLIAEDRSFGPMAKPLLFEVLDALDGIDADADVAFLLTTNRVEHLERRPGQRPGRVDLAAEIPLPDEPGGGRSPPVCGSRSSPTARSTAAARGQRGDHGLVRQGAGPSGGAVAAADAGADPGTTTWRRPSTRSSPTPRR